MSDQVDNATGFVPDTRVNPCCGAYSCPTSRLCSACSPGGNDALDGFAVLADEIMASTSLSRAVIDLLATLDAKLSTVIMRPEGKNDRFHRRAVGRIAAALLVTLRSRPGKPGDLWPRQRRQTPGLVGVVVTSIVGVPRHEAGALE